jgi:hypothetical protein
MARNGLKSGGGVVIERTEEEKMENGKKKIGQSPNMRAPRRSKNPEMCREWIGEKADSTLRFRVP